MAFEDYPGSCISCGFLAKRNANPHIPECYEVTALERAEAGIGKLRANVPTLTWCLVGAANLKEEIDELGEDKPLGERTKAIIEKGRNCDRWYAWTEFLSPKEHLERFERQQLEDNRRDFERRMEEDRRDFDLKLFEISRGVEDRVNRSNFRLTVFVAFLAILEVIATVLVLAYPNGIQRLVDWAP